MPCTGRVGKNRVQGLAYAITFRGGNTGCRERGAGGGPSHVRRCMQPAPSRLTHGSPENRALTIRLKVNDGGSWVPIKLYGHRNWKFCNYVSYK